MFFQSCLTVYFERRSFAQRFTVTAGSNEDHVAFVYRISLKKMFCAYMKGGVSLEISQVPEPIWVESSEFFQVPESICVGRAQIFSKSQVTYIGREARNFSKSLLTTLVL